MLIHEIIFSSIDRPKLLSRVMSNWPFHALVNSSFSHSLLFLFMYQVSNGKCLFYSLLRCSRRLDWIFRKLMFTLPKITFAWMFLSLMDGRQRWVLSMRMLSPRLFIASIMKVLYKFCVWILTVSSELFKGICQFATSMCISISTS